MGDFKRKWYKHLIIFPCAALSSVTPQSPLPTPPPRSSLDIRSIQINTEGGTNIFSELKYIFMFYIIYIYMSNRLNLLHPRKDVAEMVIVFCVSLIVPEDLMFAIKSGEHVYQESSFFVSPLSFLRVSWWYQVSMSWCNCSKMSEVLAGAHMYYIYITYSNIIYPYTKLTLLLFGETHETWTKNYDYLPVPAHNFPPWHRNHFLCCNSPRVGRDAASIPNRNLDRYQTQEMLPMVACSPQSCLSSKIPSSSGTKAASCVDFRTKLWKIVIPSTGKSSQHLKTPRVA